MSIILEAASGVSMHSMCYERQTDSHKYRDGDCSHYYYKCYDSHSHKGAVQYNMQSQQILNLVSTSKLLILTILFSSKWREEIALNTQLHSFAALSSVPCMLKYCLFFVIIVVICH